MAKIDWRMSPRTRARLGEFLSTLGTKDDRKKMEKAKLERLELETEALKTEGKRDTARFRWEIEDQRWKNKARHEGEELRRQVRVAEAAGAKFEARKLKDKLARWNDLDEEQQTSILWAKEFSMKANQQLQISRMQIDQLRQAMAIQKGQFDMMRAMREEEEMQTRAILGSTAPSEVKMKALEESRAYRRALKSGQPTEGMRDFADIRDDVQVGVDAERDRKLTEEVSRADRKSKEDREKIKLQQSVMTEHLQQQFNEDSFNEVMTSLYLQGIQPDSGVETPEFRAVEVKGHYKPGEEGKEWVEGGGKVKKSIYYTQTQAARKGILDKWNAAPSFYPKAPTTVPIGFRVNFAIMNPEGAIKEWASIIQEKGGTREDVSALMNLFQEGNPNKVRQALTILGAK